MANWCSTGIIFIGEDDAVSFLEKKTEEAEKLKKDPWIQKNVSFRNNTWLGSLALVLGAAYKDGDGYAVYKDGRIIHVEAWDGPLEPPTRGTFIPSYVQKGSGTLSLDIEEAWRPHEELYDFIVESVMKAGHELQYEYTAVQESDEVYVNTSRQYFGTVAIYESEDDDPIWFEGGEAEVELKKKLLSIGVNLENVKNTKDILDAFSEFTEENEEYEFTSLHFFEDREGEYLLDMEKFLAS